MTEARISVATRQGCKKSAKIKLLVDETFGDKNLSIIQTNHTSKAIKN
jgi:hypothetical protein